MQKTQNYNLNQWETSDPICRADFNSDNAAIDAALGELNSAVGGKANQADLAATNAALNVTNATLSATNNTLAATNTALAAKAEQTALDAVSAAVETKAEQTAVDALLTALGSGGVTSRMTYGSYAGTGTSGADNPSSLRFDFTPVLVILTVDQDPSVMVRGCGTAACPSGNSSASLTVTWEDRGVSWYGNTSTNQGNVKGSTYCWVAIGS